jgi:UDP-N-acetylglucosamine 2-epimerase (non-hydrolysing)
MARGGQSPHVSVLAHFHFTPTKTSRDNLIAEGVAPETIRITGNTIIDALRRTRDRLEREARLCGEIARQFEFLESDRRLILVTGHPRESFGGGFEQICKALGRLECRSDVQIFYPVHLNPSVRSPVHDLLAAVPGIHLIEPVGYPEFVYPMSQAYVILTDSGEVQEEGPALSVRSNERDRQSLWRRACSQAKRGLAGGGIQEGRIHRSSAACSAAGTESGAGGDST